MILYQVIATIAIDLSKAFDYLPHGLILEKLRFYGMGEKAANLLHSYTSSRYQRVKVGDAFSAWTGVVSILGPLLFIIFMNYLNFAIEKGNLMDYANDTKIHTSDPHPQVIEGNINRNLAITLDWFKQNERGRIVRSIRLRLRLPRYQCYSRYCAVV